MHRGTANPDQLHEVHIENEYEQQRAARIKSNAEKLLQLDVQRNVISLHVSNAPSAASKCNGSKRKRPAVKSEPQRKQPARTSARLQGSAHHITMHAASTTAPDSNAEFKFASQWKAKALARLAVDRHALLTQQEYMALNGTAEPDAFVTDGHFNGWVDPATCQQYGIADCASDAWNQNAGGKFSFKIDKSAIPASLKGQGWSSARAFSATQLKQNPNTFFYRNVAPHLQQAFGDWSEEEHNLFMQTAKAHGVGDKWGLFASYIPNRVGYQCSAYYRDVIVPSCRILDERFRLSASGKASFTG